MKKFIAMTFAAAALLSSCNSGGHKAKLETDIDTLSYEMGMVLSAEEKDFAQMLAQQGSDSAYVDEFLKGFSEGMKAADDKKKLARYMGVQAGMQLKMQLPMIEGQVFQGDSTKKVSERNFIAGYMALAKGKTALKVNGKLVGKEEANKHIMEFMFKKQRKESNDFIAKKAKEKDVKALGSGLLYKVIEPGQGTDRVSATDSIRVKYEGKLVNGTVFDSSERAKDGVATLALSNTIKAWQMALTQMPIGATWEIYVPYELGYNDRGMGAIPPYSALTFKVTLLGKK